MPKPQRTRKIFIGMLSDGTTEEDVRAIFEPFGRIAKCTVLRRLTGVSKCCAFVQYTCRDHAAKAVEQMDGSLHSMEGRQLIVQFAESQADRKKRYGIQWHTKFCGGDDDDDDEDAPVEEFMIQPIACDTTAVNNDADPQHLDRNLLLPNAYLQGGNGLKLNSTAANGLTGDNGYGKSMTPEQHQKFASNASANKNDSQHLLWNLLSTNAAFAGNGPALGLTAANGDVNAMTSLQLQQIALNAATMATAAYNNEYLKHVYWNLLLANASLVANQLFPAPASLVPPYTAFTGYPQNPSAPAPAASLQANHLLQTAGFGGGDSPCDHHDDLLTSADPSAATVNPVMMDNLVKLAALAAASDPVSPSGHVPPAPQPFPVYRVENYGKHPEGPEGANLFVYNIPCTFRDSDLLTLFSPFGNVLSTLVYYDRATNQSKRFGFVSYDNAFSALAAIRSLDTFPLYGRPLTVRLKKTGN